MTGRLGFSGPFAVPAAFAAAAFGTAAAPSAAAAQSPPVIMVPRAATPEESREYLRLEGIAKAWAEGVRRKHGLVEAGCTIPMPPTPRTTCSFGQDGIALSLWKEGRGPARRIGGRFSIGNLFDVKQGHIAIVGAAWIKGSDVFELEAGGRIYAFSCETLGEGSDSFAQCSLARSFDGLGGRARYKRGRYRIDGDFDEEIGTGLLSGRVRLFHNGRPLPVEGLVQAARDFARADFAKLAGR